MRRFLWFAASGVFAILLAAAPRTLCQQQDQSKTSPPAGASQSGGSQATPESSAPHQETLAEAARRAREQKKEAAKPARVFNNDNIPASGMISTVGSASEEGATHDGSAAKPKAAGDTTAAGAGAPAGPADEKEWRERFAKLHDKLSRDEQDLEVMQRELAVLDVANYPDPQKTLQQETTRGDINKKTADIEKQKKKIEADNQAISDAQDELRKSGGDSGWSR